MLQADVRLIDRRARDEATGEVMSLTGKLDGTRMGDRHQRVRPSKADEKKAKRQKRDESSYDLAKLKEASLLSDNLDDVAGIIYRPKTAETKQTYEVLLSFIQEALGDQPRDVICGAADEVLSVLKNEKLKDKEKKKETESLLGKYIHFLKIYFLKKKKFYLIGGLPEERFALMVNLGKKISDWGQDEKVVASEEQVDDKYGINVQFDQDSDEDNDQENIYGEVREDDDGDEDGEEDRADHAIHAETLAGSAVEDLGGKKEKKLHPLDIDAYWLQRRLSKFYSDPMISQARAGEVLQILKNYEDERECENHLVLLLGFDCFDFIKLIKQNRQMVLYCSMLASAQSESERLSLKEEMKSSPSLRKILSGLDTVRDEAGSSGVEPMETSSEPKRASQRHGGLVIKDVPSGGVGAAPHDGPTGIPGLRELLDLEEMAFPQGSHFMANKKCNLPEGSFRKQRKGYEEVHVPPLKPKPFGADEILLPIEKLPAYAQPAFEGFKTLNRVQSRLWKTALESDENMLLCAPTVFMTIKRTSERFEM